MSIKKICWIFLVVATILVATVFGINIFLVLSTKNRIVKQISNLPNQEFALVLGTEPFRPDGTTNLHFLKRTDLAAKVYAARKANHLLISGNKNNRGFNEVLEMEEKILKMNVPESVIELDFNGTRTYESIRRAAEVYHLQKMIVITDSFHAPRAIFLCEHFGIDAIAICPEKDPYSLWFFRYQFKEFFSRVIAVFEIAVRRHHEPNK